MIIDAATVTDEQIQALKPGDVVYNTICRWTLRGRATVAGRHPFSRQPYYRAPAVCHHLASNYPDHVVEMELSAVGQG